MKRRDSLRLAALGTISGSALVLPSCERLISKSIDLQEPFPETLAVPDGAEIDDDFHLLSRAAFGPRPGDLEKVRAQGREAWIEEQLAPEKIDDRLCDRRAARFESLQASIDIAFEFKKPVLRRELIKHTLLRATYSRRQLFEVMVGFWTDHFNIDLEKGECLELKPSDDRHVIREHALGNFRELLRASATSPAMLVYLDGNQNKVEAGKDEPPNENYARELLELHTMGAGRGYSQEDVAEAARALSGWRFETRGRKRFRVYFEEKFHDDGAKTVLGETIPAGLGEGDVDALVKIVCDHPATGTYLAEKLCRRFVSYDPPATLVERVAAIFREEGGQIVPMVREILLSSEFAACAGSKLKRPFRFVASSFRALGADTHVSDGVIEELLRMGHSPFQYPTPDGYPDEELAWLGTLLWRWNFAFQLVGGTLPRVEFDMDRLGKALGIKAPNGTAPRVGRAFAHLCGRRATPKERIALESLIKDAVENRPKARDLLGVMLSSPAFQRT